MVDSRVALLTDHSLFADGLASRLREYLGSLELQVFDAGQTDALAQVAAFHPAVVILEESEARQPKPCLLKEMLNILPNLTIIYLRLEQEDIQVIESERCSAKETKEVVEIIRQARSHRLCFTLRGGTKKRPPRHAVRKKPGGSH